MILSVAYGGEVTDMLQPFEDEHQKRARRLIMPRRERP